MLATLLALMACTALLVFCFFAFDLSGLAFLLLIPLGIITFVLSLILGHFISEPLRGLAAKTAALCKGSSVPLETDGQLLEANEIARNFKAISQTASAQQRDLALKEQRQASFISDVAHELRTPLTAIRGNAEMLLDPDLPPELHEKFCGIIVHESERLSELTKDLLTLQRLESDPIPLDLARVNLTKLAHEVADVLRPILEERHANLAITGEAPDVLGDAERLKQVLVNLVENATRFIEPGGHIAVELCGLRGNAVIAVKDDGCGFGDIDPKLLFDRFYRTDSSRSRGTGGTGLGLAIVKSVVEAHDGTVEAYNLPSGGACFLVAIPAIPLSE